MVCRRAARDKAGERARDRPVRTPLSTNIQHCRRPDSSEAVLAATSRSTDWRSRSRPLSRGPRSSRTSRECKQVFLHSMSGGRRLLPFCLVRDPVRRCLPSTEGNPASPSTIRQTVASRAGIQGGTGRLTLGSSGAAYRRRCPAAPAARASACRSLPARSLLALSRKNATQMPAIIARLTQRDRDRRRNRELPWPTTASDCPHSR